ncbi:hypothetical protein HanOQP8_Chr11g0426821 [Helianthus annuus]|nr:hypothetical protein HanOQP8_Chr11g0426821 [Helianthus annuus]
MSTVANPSTKKRKYKPRNPPGPNRAEINWKEEEFQNLVREMGFRPEWGAQFPTPNSTALDAPGYIALYAAFFREGNFRLPMTKFTAEVLTNYGLHISQINAMGLPRLTHFEFICKANRIEPTFEMFNVFYNVSYTGGFYSFNSRPSGLVLEVPTHRRVCMIGSRSFSISVVESFRSICITGQRVKGFPR